MWESFPELLKTNLILNNGCIIVNEDFLKCHSGYLEERVMDNKLVMHNY